MIFDVGHGGGSFSWGIAVPAVKEGFLPDSISTDLHIGSMNGGMKDMLNVMSKFLALGLPLDQVIARATSNPAKEIGHEELGHLGVGALADVAVLRLEKGDFGFIDSFGARMARQRTALLRADAQGRQDRLRHERPRTAGLEDPAPGLPVLGRPTLGRHLEEVRMANRRTFLKKGPAAAMAAAAVASTSAVSAAEKAADKPVKKVLWEGGKKPEKTPLFSGIVTFGNLVFISGIGAHFEGDITAHTKHVLDEIQKKLEFAGSSMEKVLKVNVYLNDLKDYKAMNEAFLGRFGPEPGVRTTIAAAGGIPGNSLVEIDCIASL